VIGGRPGGDTRTLGAVTGVGLVLAVLSDLFLLPDSPAAWAYAVPVLFAAVRLRPRAVAAFGSVAFVAYVVAGTLSARPWSLTLAFGAGLLILLVLAVVLASLRHVAAVRAATAEGAVRQAEEAHAQLRMGAERTRALADASLAFASSRMDLDALLDTVVRTATRRSDEGCVLFLRDDQSEDGALRLAAVYHSDEARRTFMREALSTRRLYEGEGISGQVIASGEAILIPDVSPAEVAESLSPGHREIPERLMIRGALGVPLRDGERVIGALTLWRDASGDRLDEQDRVFLQDLAVRASLAVTNTRLHEAAREAVRVRDTFIAVAAHELRTPMTALRGYAQMLARGLRREHGVGETTPRHLKEAEMVLHQADRLARLINDLLDVSRIDSGKLELHPEPVDLAALARDLVSQVQGTQDLHTNSGPGCRLSVDAPAALVVAVDRSRIEQVLLNLLINAVKFSPDGGEIEVAVTSATRTGERQPQEVVRLSVRDHGVGIPPERREQVFQRFYQAHDGAGGGMGLGLYVSRQIVERHGGRIWAEALDDGGTRFVCELPMRPPE
jgi:signal transduction histidine kinase